MEPKRKNSITGMAQILIWTCVFLLPAFLNWSVGGDAKQARIVFKSTCASMLPCLLLYLVNYLWLVKAFLLGSRKKIWFYLINFALLLVLNVRFLHPGPIPQEVLDQIPFKSNQLWAMYAVAGFAVAGIQVLFILMAVGLRYMVHTSEIEAKLLEEKQKSSEAELTWLKSQLNPHFLFNTLNNISSLTQIDPDKAQESIGQLSDLLRYALYDSNQETVPLSGEIDFMTNYIDLMKLRCNSLTEVSTSLKTPGGDVQIAPLLFISLIENAFKHGVNARHASFVRIRLDFEGRNLVFDCENSVFEKAGTDHIGSGIGLENMVRRLGLIYPGRYVYTHDSEESAYRARVIIKDLI